MNKTLKKILINLSIVGITAGIIGGLVGIGFLVSYNTDKKYESWNTFDVNEEGMIMVAAKDNNQNKTCYSCLNKNKDKEMKINEFESDPFTTYYYTSVADEMKFLDIDEKEIENDETVSFIKEKIKTNLYINHFYFTLYKTEKYYLLSYNIDHHAPVDSSFCLTFYNKESNSLSLIKTYSGNEVVGLKILSELK